MFFIAIAVTLIVLILTGYFFLGTKSSSSKEKTSPLSSELIAWNKVFNEYQLPLLLPLNSAKGTLLLVGPSQSGKTALFYATTQNRDIQRICTLPSLIANKGTLRCRPWHLVDIPGHSALFETEYLSYRSTANVIVVVMDVTMMESSSYLNQVSLLLYRLLTDKVIVKKKTAIWMVAAKWNDAKSRKETAVKLRQLRSSLEQGVNTIKSSQRNHAPSQDNEDIVPLESDSDSDTSHPRQRFHFHSHVCGPIPIIPVSLSHSICTDSETSNDGLELWRSLL